MRRIFLPSPKFTENTTNSDHTEIHNQVRSMNCVWLEGEKVGDDIPVGGRSGGEYESNARSGFG